MRHTAKLFMNGRSQAVRLPAKYRFDCSEVFIRQDPATGDLVISSRPGDWASFFAMIDNTDIPLEFMQDRDNNPPQLRELF